MQTSEQGAEYHSFRHSFILQLTSNFLIFWGRDGKKESMSFDFASGWPFNLEFSSFASQLNVPGEALQYVNSSGEPPEYLPMFIKDPQNVCWSAGCKGEQNCSGLLAVASLQSFLAPVEPVVCSVLSLPGKWFPLILSHHSGKESVAGWRWEMGCSDGLQRMLHSTDHALWQG